MHHVTTIKVVVTSQNFDNFWLVTMRLIAHSGRFVYIRICVSEFVMDTGQPLVTSRGMSNHLSDHH